ncbi:hypothetical protein SPH9361_04418 [Sphingobium sp. CECT 9361]|nr:hypothetical protein SPH9361_04418 [Sphingobium sp. CECT 9361]
MFDKVQQIKTWEDKFGQARACLEDFASRERSWFSSIGDPRTYQSDMRQNFDRYVAVFPEIPGDLALSLGDAIRNAVEGMHALARSLVYANGHDPADSILFPFAADRQSFSSKAHQMLLGRFAQDVQEMLCDMAPYGDGDPKLFLLHQLSAYGTGLGLAPYAAVPQDCPPKIGVLQLNGKRVEVREELSDTGDNCVAPHSSKGWNAQTRTLVIAQWPRRRHIHVQAKIRAWANYGPFPSAPLLACDKPALAFTTEIIDRAYDAAYDLWQRARLCEPQTQRSRSG